MDEVFTLTQRNPTNHAEDFVYSSQNICDIIDKMFSVDYAEIGDFQIYVACFDGNSVFPRVIIQYLIKNGEVNEL